MQKLFLYFLFTFIFFKPHLTKAEISKSLPIFEIKPDVHFVEKLMMKKKFSKRFVKEMKLIYEDETFGQVVRLNMLGFLNPPQHANLVTEEGVQSSLSFIRKNKTAFKKVQKKYHVPAEVIASLLWVETRHGQVTGHFHVASVYMHLLQVGRPDVQKNLFLIAQALEKNKPQRTAHLKKTLHEKALKKSKWALTQLQALEKIYKKKHQLVLELNGSFAGAFGVSQFIPTSYLTYAKAYNPQKVADLYKPEDALTSVANYLKKNGWGPKRKNKMKALMHYNNSTDYAESILNLAKKLKH